MSTPDHANSREGAGRPLVLAVDDDERLLRLLGIRLRAGGYEVATACSGDEAVAVLARSRPALVITDLRMDGLDGMGLLQYVRQNLPTLPVIILTAHGTIPEAVAATREGAFDFLTKPFESERLLDVVSRALSLNAGPAVPGEESEEWRRDILTRNAGMEDLLGQARMVAATDSSVLVLGESGTGKELLAKAMHRASSRAGRPFMAINCSAIPEPLLESELFGHSKGSFSGAVSSHPGLFRAAEAGTVFLDEIGDMPLNLQAKLLRALQERQVRPVGATEAVPVDVRIVSATNCDLEQAMADGAFREDLYYRLNVITLEIPPLRERPEDVPLLAGYFLEQLAERARKPVSGFAPEALEVMLRAPWPGNVRQLYNVVEQAVVLTTTPVVAGRLVEKALRRDGEGALPSFAEARGRFERDYLVRLLNITNGNVAQAARIAKRNRTEFYRLLQRHRLDPAPFKDGAEDAD